MLGPVAEIAAAVNPAPRVIGTACLGDGADGAAGVLAALDGTLDDTLNGTLTGTPEGGTEGAVASWSQPAQSLPDDPLVMIYTDFPPRSTRFGHPRPRHRPWETVGLARPARWHADANHSVNW